MLESEEVQTLITKLSLRSYIRDDRFVVSRYTRGWTSLLEDVMSDELVVGIKVKDLDTGFEAQCDFYEDIQHNYLVAYIAVLCNALNAGIKARV